MANETGGYLLGSQALFADAIHAVTDLIADLVAVAAVSCSSILGLRYAKAIGGIAVSGLVLSSGSAVVAHAMVGICHDLQLDRFAESLAYVEAFSHPDHTTDDDGSSQTTIWLSLVSIIAKECLYRATLEVAKKEKSVMLESHALHQRLDAITAVVALVVNAISQLDARLAWLHGFRGLIIGATIAKAGFSNAVAAMKE